jgi:hypothetical protein
VERRLSGVGAAQFDLDTEELVDDAIELCFPRTSRVADTPSLMLP